MMKKLFFIFVLTLLPTLLLFSGAFIERFNARSDNNNVLIEWKSGEEVNLKQYEVERKASNSDFISIAIILPKGSQSSYDYTDKSAYKTTDAVYSYRLKIIDNNPSVSPTYTNSIIVSHRVSGVKSTWGSIKSMFR